MTTAEVKQIVNEFQEADEYFKKECLEGELMAKINCNKCNGTGKLGYLKSYRGKPIQAVVLPCKCLHKGE